MVFTCLLLLANSSALAAYVSDSPWFWKIEDKMHMLAGKDAIDCGRIRPPGDPKLIVACANDQLLTKHSFEVGFDYQWGNLSGFEGFVGDASGNVYQVSYDSERDWTPAPIPQDEYINGYIFLSPCPSPAHIYMRQFEAKSFELTCHRLESPGQPPGTVRLPLE